jgi:hypothetical protein
MMYLVSPVLSIIIGVYKRRALAIAAVTFAESSGLPNDECRRKKAGLLLSRRPTTGPIRLDLSGFHETVLLRWRQKLMGKQAEISQ